MPVWAVSRLLYATLACRCACRTLASIARGILTSCVVWLLQLHHTCCPSLTTWPGNTTPRPGNDPRRTQNVSGTSTSRTQRHWQAAASSVHGQGHHGIAVVKVPVAAQERTVGAPEAPHVQPGRNAGDHRADCGVHALKADVG